MNNAQFIVTENFVWQEFSTAFCYNKKIRAYIDRRKKFNRWSNWGIVIISVIASISYWSNTKIGAICSAIAAICLVAKELLPIFNQSENELMELNKAATFFSEYQVEMEKLYVSLKYNHLHPVFCQEDFFRLKKEAAKFLTLTNQYFRGLPNKIDNSINRQLDNYVNTLYNQN